MNSAQSEEKNTLHFLLWSNYYPDIKGKQRKHKKRKLQNNTPHEYRYKNSLKIISK